VKFNEALVSCKLLLEQQDFDRAILLLDRALPIISTDKEWNEALKLVENIPETHRIASIQAAVVYARVLYENHRLTDVIEFCTEITMRHEKLQVVLVQLECTRALIDSNKLGEAKKVIESIIPYLSGEHLGIAYRRLGLVLFKKGQFWYGAFENARALLSGDQLGRALLDQGYCLSESGMRSEARHVWLEALPLFRSHPKMLSWLRYNLGSSYIDDLELIEAERHFLEGERLSRNPKSFSMRASIFNGLAGVRRVQGEWSRSEFSYREALRIAADPFDRVTSLIDLTRTILLAGRAPEANETLELQLNPEDANDPNIQIARALVCLHLNNLPRASAALETITTPIVGAYQWLERLCRAELARRHGQFTEAVQWLEGNPTHTLHMREEVRQWPELFALAKAAGLPIPEPLEYVQGSTVQVRARGVLHVAVNDRGVSIPPTGRVGELLVFLLEHEGEAPLDVILEAFYPNAVGSKDRARARKMVWEHANTLRELLGWQDAVIALGGAYQLDPETTWQYDIREARALGLFNGEFLAGVYSEWALEVGQDLARFAVDSDVGVHLN
jgi:tetratricopeptide (TPR) repeat protein